MPPPDRPNETVLSPWKARAKVLAIRERWRVFCDAQVRRLNSPEPVRTPAHEAAGDGLAAVPPEGRGVVIAPPAGWGSRWGGNSMLRSKLAALMACGLAAAAWAGDDPVARDTEALQGEWRAVKGTAEGQKTPTAEAEMFRIAVKGDRLTLSAGGEARKARFVLDPAKSPKAIDLTWLDGPEKGRTVPGVYALEKGRWRLCVPNAKAGEAVQRPKEFTAAAGERRMLFTLERGKPE